MSLFFYIIELLYLSRIYTDLSSLLVNHSSLGSKSE